MRTFMPLFLSWHFPCTSFGQYFIWMFISFSRFIKFLAIISLNTLSKHFYLISASSTVWAIRFGLKYFSCVH